MIKVGIRQYMYYKILSPALFELVFKIYFLNWSNWLYWHLESHLDLGNILSNYTNLNWIKWQLSSKG